MARDKYDPFWSQGPIKSPMGDAAQKLSTVSPSDPVLSVIRNTGSGAAFIQAATGGVASYSRQIYYASAGDPTWTFTRTAGGYGSGSGVATSFQIKCPANLNPSTDYDAPVTIVAPDGNYFVELYHVINVNSGAHTASFVRAEQGGAGQSTYGVDGPGIQWPWTNGQTKTVNATGAVPNISGLVTGYDIAQGVIRHTLALGMRNTNMNYSSQDTTTGRVSNGRRNPASTADGGAPTTYTGSSPYFGMGTLIFIPQSVNVASYFTAGTPSYLIAKALQDYGGIVTDQAGVSAFKIYAAQDVSGSFVNSVNGASGLRNIGAAFDVCVNWQRLADLNDPRLMVWPKGGGNPVVAYSEPYSANDPYQGSSPTPTVDENATLTGLTISAGTLSPSFATGTLSYDAGEVAYGVSSIDVTATMTDAGMVMTINEASATSGVAKTVNLATGRNTITIAIDPNNGNTGYNYSIDILRLPPQISATLSMKNRRNLGRVARRFIR